MGEWISVEDRLPEEKSIEGYPEISVSEPVLVYCKNTTGNGMDFFFSVDCVLSGKWCNEKEVKFWMNIPEPPEV